MVFKIRQLLVAHDTFKLSVEDVITIWGFRYVQIFQKQFILSTHISFDEIATWAVLKLIFLCGMI